MRTIRFRVCRCLILAALLGATAALQAAAPTVLTNSFDERAPGGRLAWKVVAGAVTFEGGEMCFGRQANSTVQLDLGDTAWKEAVSVAFRLRQIDDSKASYLFHVGLQDTDRDKGYSIACSPHAGYFGTSGFYDGKTVGAKGAALRGDADWQQMALRFDPAGDRLVLTQDGKPVWQGTNVLRLPRVNRLVFSSGGTVRWRVDNVRIDVVRNAPAAKPDPGTSAVQIFCRDGVPHTDKNGRPLSRFDPGRSFFQIGIWGVPMGEIWGTNYDWQILVDAGFNTVWPWSRDLKQTLAEAAKHNLQLVQAGEIDSALLQGVKDHPHLLGNVWHDEPTGNFWGKDMQAKFDAFVAYRRQVRTVAPGLPVFVNDVPWITPPATEWWIRWNTAGDVTCHDNYPIKHSGHVDSVGEIGPPLALAVQSNGQKKPVWLIVGAFEQPGPGAFPFRFPTPAQLRACVYAGLIHGATGIIYFTWDTYVPRDGNVIGMSPHPKIAYVPNPQQPGYTHPTPATPVQLVESQSLWAMATAINREVRELVPSLLSPTAGEGELDYRVFPDLSHSPCPMRCVLKRHPEGGYVLLTCNIDAAVLDCKFQMSKPLASVERMFENQPAWRVEPGSHSWQIWYEPFEVHVFRIRTK
ncbi:MAG: hypothetical protein ACLQNE_18845 [Thermoguttaceae bacterium]